MSDTIDKPKDIETLRSHLFGTLEALRNEQNPMDLERARTVAEVAQVIINSAKVEADMAKATGGMPASTFIRPALEGPTDAGPGTPEKPRLIQGRYQSGSR